MEKIKLSVVILTKNSQEIIEDSLKSVYGWVDEIVVVDDTSTDQTLEIVKKYTDRIYVKKWKGKARTGITLIPWRPAIIS